MIPFWQPTKDTMPVRQIGLFSRLLYSLFFACVWTMVAAAKAALSQKPEEVRLGGKSNKQFSSRDHREGSRDNSWRKGDTSALPQTHRRRRRTTMACDTCLLSFFFSSSSRFPFSSCLRYVHTLQKVEGGEKEGRPAASPSFMNTKAARVCSQQQRPFNAELFRAGKKSPHVSRPMFLGFLHYFLPAVPLIPECLTLVVTTSPSVLLFFRGEKEGREMGRVRKRAICRKARQRRRSGEKKKGSKHQERGSQGRKAKKKCRGGGGRCDGILPSSYL